MSAHEDCYRRAPLEARDGVPIFSAENDYTRNYEHIAREHLTAVEKTGQNPWIAEELWVQMEASTTALIEEYASPGDRILDVGVGLGRLLEKVPELERYGLDISFTYLQIARSKGINVCYSLVEDMPYKERFFDVVICTDVLEHVLDLNYAVAQILSTLKDDGVLIVRVPYRESMAGYTSPACAYDYSHVRDFDEHTLRLLFTKIFPCTVETTQLCGHYDHGEEKLRFPYGEYLRTDTWLQNLKRIAPELFWDFLRRFGVPSELCAVVKKRRNLSAALQRHPRSQDAGARADPRIERLRDRYNELKQKYAFLTAISQAATGQSMPDKEHLAAETERLKRTCEELTASNEQLNAQARELKQANDELSARARALSDEIEQLKLTSGQLAANTKELRDEAEGLRETRAHLTKEAGELKQENEELKTHIEGLQKTGAQLSEMNDHLNARCEELSAHVEALRRRISIDPRGLWRRLRRLTRGAKEPKKSGSSKNP